jgi:hypothetical protein
MLTNVVGHLLTNVLPAAQDYNDAEVALSVSLKAVGGDQIKCRKEAETAKRRAADVAVALDGLADRAARALGQTPNGVRAQVALICSIQGVLRDGCIDRVCAVANAYKHDVLCDPKHPIRLDADVLVVGAGYGIDGFGMGKHGGIEVMVHQSDGTKHKFLADVPYSIAGWFAFLKHHGAQLPSDKHIVCGLTVNP